MNRIAPVDVVANTVRGPTAGRLIGKVKPAGVFASVTGAPENAKEFRAVRVVAFVSKQDAKTLRRGSGGRRGQLVIPIARKLPLKDAAAGHAAVEKGVDGKVLLLP